MDDSSKVYVLIVRSEKTEMYVLPTDIISEKEVNYLNVTSSPTCVPWKTQEWYYVGFAIGKLSSFALFYGSTKKQGQWSDSFINECDTIYGNWEAYLIDNYDTLNRVYGNGRIKGLFFFTLA